MSTLTITFQTQVLDFGPLTRGRIEIEVDIGTATNPFLTETLVTTTAQTYQFQEAAHNVGDPQASHNQQANYFAFSFNRDYKSIGGVKNMQAVAVDNVVTITATLGTFVSFAYTGNVLGQADGVINNIAQPTTITFSSSLTGTGDCSVVEYSLTATGDDQPFKVSKNGVDVITGWDGTAQTLNLTRGIPQNLFLYGNSGALLRTIIQIPPRKLVATEFKETITPFTTYSDVLIEKLVTVANTEPLEYAITDKDDVTGSGYQVSNSFPGIAPDEYRLWIKDVYGCEVSKLITVSAFQDPTITENIRYFLIPEGQSIQFSEFKSWGKDVKRNFFNTGSFNELVLENRYCVKQFYDPSDPFQGVQFRSSYDWHTVTLHDMNGGATDLAAIMIQQNLGVVEKVDCMIWPVGDKTGVYFNGGNSYLENTTTILPDPSPYDGTTPRWSKVGQLVELDGIGIFTIEQVGYDDTRGGYFIINTVTVSETASIVQATYNAHDYNLFEFYFNPADLTSQNFIVIEKGFEQGIVDGDSYVSDLIVSKVDTEDDIKILWSDSKNRGNIVFQSGIQYLFRRNGEFYGDFTDNESEVYPGDDQTYSLDQSSHLNFMVKFEMLSAKQVNMLNIASALETFNVNGINLVRKDSPAITRYGKTNMHSWECIFAFGGNQVGIVQDEIVLSVSTGVVGGGSTGTTPAPDLSGIILFKNSNGDLISVNGNLTKN